MRRVEIVERPEEAEADPRKHHRQAEGEGGQRRTCRREQRHRERGRGGWGGWGDWGGWGGWGVWGGRGGGGAIIAAGVRRGSRVEAWLVEHALVLEECVRPPHEPQQPLTTHARLDEADGHLARRLAASHNDDALAAAGNLLEESWHHRARVATAGKTTEREAGVGQSQARFDEWVKCSEALTAHRLRSGEAQAIDETDERRGTRGRGREDGGERTGRGATRESWTARESGRESEPESGRESETEAEGAYG